MMKRFFGGLAITLLLSVLSVSGHAKYVDYVVAEKDVVAFLGFAEKYIDLASKYYQNQYFADIGGVLTAMLSKQKTYLANEKFLKSQKWDFTKLNNFIYQVSIAMESLRFEEEMKRFEGGYGLEELGIYEDVSEDERQIVAQYRDRLEKYFPPIDLMEKMEEKPLQNDYTLPSIIEPKKEVKKEKPVKKGGKLFVTDKIQPEMQFIGQASGKAFPEASRKTYANLVINAIIYMIGLDNYKNNQKLIDSTFMPYVKATRYLVDSTKTVSSDKERKWVENRRDNNGNLQLKLRGTIDMTKLKKDLESLGLSY